MVHSSQSIMYNNLHNTVYTVYHCTTIYYVHCCTLSNVLQCNMYSVHCTPMYKNAHCAVYKPIYLHIYNMHCHESSDLLINLHTTDIIHNNYNTYIYRKCIKSCFTRLPLEAFLAWFDRYEHIFFPSQY